MDFNALYHFLFETIAGVGILVGCCFLLSVIACVIMEIRTRKRFKSRPQSPDEDSWDLFDSDDDQEK